MTTRSRQQFSADDLVSTLIENSELDHFDTLAILTAINTQTVVLNQILVHLQTSPTQTLPQQNIPQPSVQNTYIEQSGREKLSKKLLSTADWITTNDPELKLSVRQVAALAKVSIGTAQAAIKLITDERSK
ncbi:MAG: hypothetical protein GC179_08770 [Anaerolineaceae bacterium]|nr:hypothetical protein [Anaerolineaceae bacterium]